MMNEVVTTVFEKLQEVDVVMIKGPAGSGKTTVIKALVAEARRLHRPSLLMAPTGRAAKVLTDRSGEQASTIHKCIYGEVALEEHFDESGDSSTYKWIFAQKTNTLPANSIIIVDETSMISDTYSDQERMRFGSGFLLRDLLRFSDLKATNNTYKLILVGDPYQLPPVGSKNSPALEKSYLEKNYQLKVAEILLTKVFRQAKGSGILENAQKLRTCLDQQNYSSFSFTYNEELLRLTPVDFVRQYQAITQGKVDPSVLVVAQDNQSVNTYNRWIRSLFFPDAKGLVPGDILLVTQNNYAPDKEQPNEVLYNGDFAEVVEVFPGIERETGVLRRKGEILSFGFTFQKARIRTAAESKLLVVRFLLELLDSPEPGLTDEQSDALYVNFRMRYSHLKPGSPEFVEALKKDPYMNALKVKYGYAVTCHKAQGGEWQTVFVDYKHHGGQKHQAFFRWAYTALTRAKTRSFSMESPDYTAFSGSVTVMDDARLCERFAEVRTLVLDALKEMNLEVMPGNSHSYHDYYTLKTDACSARMRVTYNKELEITDVLVTSEDPAQQASLQTQLRMRLLGRRAGGIATPVSEPDLAEDPRMSEVQKRIEKSLLEAGRRTGIALTNRAIFSKYQIRYCFTKETCFCEADYYTNEKGFVTRIVQGKTSVGGEELIKKITMHYE